MLITQNAIYGLTHFLRLGLHMLMVWRSRLDTPISSSILALVFLIVHEMRSMRLQHHISKAAILLRLGLFRVQVSEAYKAIGNTRAWTSLTLVVLVIHLSAQILDRFVIAERAIANQCLISWLQPPSLVIRHPRKLNLETDSTSLPLIMRGPSTLSGPMAMIFVLLTLKRRPSSSLSTLTLFKSSAMSATLVAIKVVSSA